MHILRAPLLNANEDSLVVDSVHVAEGDMVSAGDLLFSLESTKASTDVEAPAAGFVRRLAVGEGDRIAVGALLCVLTENSDDALPALPEDDAPEEGAVKATRRARELAEAHGIDLSALGVRGIVKERDVRRHLDGSSPSSAGGVTFSLERPKAVVFGAGGHARVVIDIVRQTRPDLELVGAVDDGDTPPAAVFGVPVLGSSELLGKLKADGVNHAILGVGAVTNNKVRGDLFARLVEHGFDVPALVHPRACVEPSARIGPGAQIFAGAVVGSNASVGANVIVNSGVVVSHDCIIGSHVHLTPGAILAGGVTIGENSVVGMAVTIYLGVRVGRDVVISNGVDVLSDVPDGELVRAATGARRDH
ncbi:MAG: NeuD/PglB/VioB family sugar acetyltransferase [Deltaproteobacteria bacterium]|nr:NeuD/PglB/VioB family sugar acetyltransferase [Deltaproteobacteria bacterium]